MIKLIANASGILYLKGFKSGFVEIILKLSTDTLIVSVMGYELTKRDFEKYKSSRRKVI